MTPTTPPHRLRCETCEPKCRTYLDDVAVDGLYAVRLMLGTVTTMKGCASYSSAKSEGETMKPVIKSEFKEWFKQQFGKRSSSKSLHDLQEETVRLEVAAVNARHLYDQVRLYDDRMTAALYAWVAREKILNEREIG